MRTMILGAMIALALSSTAGAIPEGGRFSYGTSRHASGYHGHGLGRSAKPRHVHAGRRHN